MHKITVYVPSNALDTVKQALFDAGAGQIGEYARCCWQTTGRGQFLPSNSSNPHIGERGTVSAVEEILLELVCDDAVLKPVLQALVETHPYETPAYAAWPVIQLDDL